MTNAIYRSVFIKEYIKTLPYKKLLSNQFNISTIDQTCKVLLNNSLQQYITDSDYFDSFIKYVISGFVKFLVRSFDLIFNQ